MTSLCLLCLTIKEDCEIIFEICFGNYPACDFVKNIFQIQIDQSQDLNMMCKTCSSTLKKFYVFYNMVKNAQEEYFGAKEEDSCKALLSTNKSDESKFTLMLKDEMLDECHIKKEIADSQIEIEFHKQLWSQDQHNPDKYNPVSLCEDDNNSLSSVQSFPEDVISKEDISISTQCQSVETRKKKKKGKSGISSLNKKTRRSKRTTREHTSEDDSTHKSVKPVQKISIHKKSNSTLSANTKTKMVRDKSVLKSHLAKATKTVCSKYRIDEIYKDGKWVLNDRDRRELLSWYVDMKCPYTGCTSNTSFDNLFDMEQHAAEMHGSHLKLLCCDNIFDTESLLEEHVLKKHIMNNKKIKNIFLPCNICGKMIRKNSMKYHLARHLPNDKRDIKCDQCDAGFSTKSQLKNHLNTAHSNLSLPCEDCGKICKNELSLYVHKTRHKKDNFYLCPECGKKIISLDNYKEHLDQHYGRGVKVKCEICGKVVKKWCLRRHLQLHDPSNMKQCPHCPYKAIHRIQDHIKRVHEKIKPYSCSLCPIKCATKSELGDHVSSYHTGIPRHNCSFCDKTFMSSGNFFMHQKRMHPKELAEKRKEKDVNLDDVPVGKIKRGRTEILEGEDSVALENKMLEDKINKAKRLKPSDNKMALCDAE